MESADAVTAGTEPGTDQAAVAGEAARECAEGDSDELRPPSTSGDETGAALPATGGEATGGVDREVVPERGDPNGLDVAEPEPALSVAQPPSIAEQQRRQLDEAGAATADAAEGTSGADADDAATGDAPGAAAASLTVPSATPPAQLALPKHEASASAHGALGHVDVRVLVANAESASSGSIEVHLAVRTAAAGAEDVPLGVHQHKQCHARDEKRAGLRYRIMGM